MKASNILHAAVGITAVAAAPTGSGYAALETRQMGAVANELKLGPCRPVTFLMARGSTETSNVGVIVGPGTCGALKGKLGADKVACQGIGTEDGYAAELPPNFMPQNTDPQSIRAAVNMVNLAVTKCPQTTVVMGGYSQGSAVVDNAIQQMPPASKEKVAGVVLWGFTRATQDNFQIPGYPKAKTKIFCAPGDLVCTGTLNITPAHLSYGQNAGESGAFLAQMATAAVAGAGGAAGAAGTAGAGGAEDGGAGGGAAGGGLGGAGGGLGGAGAGGGLGGAGGGLGGGLGGGFGGGGSPGGGFGGFFGK